MTRRRFFVPLGNIRGGIAWLSSDQVHHLRDVLRLRPGDEVEIFDGNDAGYLGRVETAGSEWIVGSLRKLETTTESTLRIILALALTKSDRFDWTLQKSTELGVQEIVPLEARFSSVRLTEARLPARMERWRRIVQEASKQCRRVSVPLIHPVCPANDFLTGADFPEHSRLFFDEKSPECWGRDIPGSDRLVLCIGPEGGWDSAEVEAAGRSGYRILNLGPRILRAETAAVTALAILQFEWGDLGQHGRGKRA